MWVEWVHKSEREWNGRAEDWHSRSEEMWESGSRKDILPLLKKHLNNGDKICDLGCGDGYASFQLAKEGFHVTGVDVSGNMIEKAKKRAEELPLTFIKEDISVLPFLDGTFDAVMAINSLEWTENPFKVLNEIKRVLKKDGLLCIAILGPTAMPRMNSYRRLLGEKVICNTMMPWEMEKIAEEIGLTMIEELGVMKREAENLPISFLSRDLKQALSFLWVYLLKN